MVCFCLCKLLRCEWKCSLWNSRRQPAVWDVWHASGTGAMWSAVVWPRSCPKCGGSLWAPFPTQHVWPPSQFCIYYNVCTWLSDITDNQNSSIKSSYSNAVRHAYNVSCLTVVPKWCQCNFSLEDWCVMFFFFCLQINIANADKVSKINKAFAEIQKEVQQLSKGTAAEPPKNQQVISLWENLRREAKGM